MPTLKKTEFIGQITWLGHVPGDGGSLRAGASEQLDLIFDGTKGERHTGRERLSCVRVNNLYREGTTIRNVRQLSILSAEELAGIAADIGLETLDPGLLGASMVVQGLPDFSHVPPSSRLQMPSGATVTVDMENRPCVFPGQEIEAENQGHGKAFLGAAKGRRGVTAWVEKPGPVQVGDAVVLFVPDQRAWTG
ncbi:MAG: MOSC domain-containing protein [Sedimentitalea sp.]